jgi:iron complex transport system substrate-binding protein
MKRLDACSTTRKSNRIVSLAPSVTSILCALGARSQLVGVTKWCKDVAPVAHLPQLGDCWSLDTAPVMALKPTLIIGSVPYKIETVQKILELPVNFLATNPRSLADIEADIRMLGAIVKRAASADKIVAKMRVEFAEVSRRASKLLRGGARPRVYSEAWPKPRISSPPWVAELVQIAGGEMVLPPGGRVTDEQVAAAKPDVIVIAWAATGNRPSTAKTLKTEAWQKVPAIRNKRVYVLRDDWLNTPGPILIRGARELSRVLHKRSAYGIQVI